MVETFASGRSAGAMAQRISWSRHALNPDSRPLADDKLAPECRSLIESAYGSVRSGHDEMSRLKHSLDA